MSVFGNYSDLSNQIIREGSEITIGFQRNNDGTGTVTWNIPPPANGCTSETQAYDGIVITVSEQPADYITTSPKNQVIYEADSTVNVEANLGSHINTAAVIGAFYHNKTTTSLTVTDVDPNKWYYISGYAVDNVGTYHREGVHAYALPTGSDEKAAIDGSAFQDINIIPRDSSHSVYANTSTGLDKTQDYTFSLKIDGVTYPITIKGVEAQTYGDLIKAINNQLKLLGYDYYSAPFPPNRGKYYLNLQTSMLYQWDGFRNVPEQLVVFDQDPATTPQGAYWYNSITGIIYMYETGGWQPQPLIKLDHEPNQPTCGELWFTGTEVYEWDGDHWIKLCLFVQTRNPQLAPILNCNTYWFDETQGIFYKWNANTLVWDEELAIVSKKDPNTLSVGDFWLNETDGKMYRFSAGMWSQVVEIRYDETTPTDPAANIYWYNPSTQEFVKRSSDNTTWIPYEYTLYPTDPKVRKSNDLWWNQNSSIDTLYVWDIVNNVWLPVDNFYQTLTDPALPPNIPTCAVWYNPSDGTLKYIIQGGCTDKEFIFSTFDPTRPIAGTVWYDTKNNLWYVWNGVDWDAITPIVSTFDPFVLFDGYFWYNPTTMLLKRWNGTTWVATDYSLHPLNPQIGDKWLNTVTNELNTWTGVSWVLADPIAFAALKFTKSSDPFFNGKGYIRFETTAKGCGHSIEIIPDAAGLFTKLAQSIMYTDSVAGSDGIVSGTTYNQLGVGTDGSPDERRAVHDYIRQFLGYPTLQVELFKSQIEVAIDTALLLIRKYSGFSVTRNFFFLDLQPNQQIYTLTNKCVGFNKIVNIKEINRMRAGWIRSGLAGNDLFGVAALQQLYTVGSFDMLSFHLMSSYIKELEMLFATRIVYQWDEKSRQLRIFQHVPNHERVLVDAFIERTEQDLLTSRETSLWIKKWALAEAKQILGQTRGKYVNLAGPNGSTSLNAQDLLSQSSDEKTQLKEELLDPAMQDYNGVGAALDIVIG